MLLNNNFNKQGQNNSFTKPIGNYFENNQFINKNQQFQEKINQQPDQKNLFTKDIKTSQHINPLNKNDMADKTLAVLHERLKQGTISLEEFNKRCNELGKKRQQ